MSRTTTFEITTTKSYVTQSNTQKLSKDVLSDSGCIELILVCQQLTGFFLLYFIMLIFFTG